MDGSQKRLNDKRGVGDRERESEKETMRRIQNRIIRFRVYFVDEMTIKLNVIWHKNVKLKV